MSDILSSSLIYALCGRARIVPIIAIGIFATSFAVNLGLMRKFDRLIKLLLELSELDFKVYEGGVFVFRNKFYQLNTE